MYIKKGLKCISKNIFKWFIWKMFKVYQKQCSTCIRKMVNVYCQKYSACIWKMFNVYQKHVPYMYGKCTTCIEKVDMYLKNKK